VVDALQPPTNGHSATPPEQAAAPVAVAEVKPPEPPAV
jgi:hypothetical protein